MAAICTSVQSPIAKIKNWVERGRSALIKLIFPLFLFTSIFICKVLPLLVRRKTPSKDILFLENFPIENAGYQYRAKKWAEIFTINGFSSEVITIENSKNKFDEYLKKNTAQFLIKSMFLRIKQCLYARNFKIVIVRRELLLFNDYGNCYMEKFLLAIHSNVILDFDDDISASKKQPKEITNLYGKLLLENGNKFNDTLRLYSKFIVGSKYLKNKVLKENTAINCSNICIIPTCVDYDKESPKEYKIDKGSDLIVFGWIGGNHNHHCIDIIIDPLNQIHKTQKVKLLVVSGGKYANCKAAFTIENLPWSVSKEKESVKKFDIGLMPIPNNEVSLGKCAFKLIQYMGLGIISIATGITANNDVIDNNIDGFLVKSDNSNWFQVISKVLRNKRHFPELSKKATEKIFTHYSFIANTQQYIKFIINNK